MQKKFSNSFIAKRVGEYLLTTKLGKESTITITPLVSGCIVVIKPENDELERRFREIYDLWSKIKIEED